MSEVKHTPGPWYPTRDHTGAWWIHVDADRLSTFIARVSSAGTFTATQDEANARLIAAAPELLEALREALKSAYQALADYSYERKMEHIKKTVAILEGGIAKVKGGQG